MDEREAARGAPDGKEMRTFGFWVLFVSFGAPALLKKTAYSSSSSSSHPFFRPAFPLSWGKTPIQIMMSLVCGAAAGLISSTATFPLDLVRRRMQLGGGGSPSGSFSAAKPPRPTYAGVVRDVLSRAGPAGFYAGIMPEYYKVAPGVAIGFCTYEACRELLGVSPSLAFR